MIENEGTPIADNPVTEPADEQSDISAIFGYNENTDSENNQITEESNETENEAELSENDKEAGLEEELKPYALEEIEAWDTERDGPMDPKRVIATHKSFQSDYTKKTQKLSVEKKSFEEQMKEFRAKRDAVEEAAKIGLTTEEALAINEAARSNVENMLKNYELEFDPEDPNHKELLDTEKTRITEDLKARKNRDGSLLKIRSRLADRYGYDFQRIDAEAGKMFRRLPREDGDTLLEALNNGNLEMALAFYDEAKARLNGASASREPARKRNIAPPHSISGGNSPTLPKKAVTDMEMIIKR